MKAEMTSTSPPSCRSTSHRYRSAWRTVAAYTAVSAYVSPIRKNNGSTGNDPGAIICANVAEPSSTVLITARTAISKRSLRRRSEVGGPSAADTDAWAITLCQFADHVEDGHVHRDDDAADDNAEKRDHDRLEQRQHACDGRVDFLFIEVGDFRKHRVERARRLADADHLRDHPREDRCLTQRRRNRFAAFDALPRGHDRVFDDRVA